MTELQPFHPGDIVRIRPSSPHASMLTFGRVDGCHTYQTPSDVFWSVDVTRLMRDDQDELYPTNVKVYMIPSFDCALVPPLNIPLDCEIEDLPF